MSDPFEAYASFDYATRTIVATNGEPVPFQVLVEAARAAERGRKKETWAVLLLYARTAARFVISLIGLSGILLAALGFGVWFMLALHPGTVPAALIWTGASVIGVGILILRGIVRSNDDGHFFISEPAALAMHAHAEARAALTRGTALEIERHVNLSRLPPELTREIELLGYLGKAHADEIDRFKNECIKARRYVDRGHMDADEAASKLQALRSRLHAEQADLEKALKLADRLAIAHAHGSADDYVVVIERDELGASLRRMKEEFSRPGRAFESTAAAGADPRYPDGRPHD